MNIDIQDVEQIGSNAHYSFRIGRMQERWVAFGLGQPPHHKQMFFLLLEGEDEESYSYLGVPDKQDCFQRAVHSVRYDGGMYGDFDCTDFCNLPAGIEAVGPGVVWDANQADPRVPGEDLLTPPDVGVCCACLTEPATSFMPINRRAVLPCRGAWGCVVCGIGSEGAVVVLCDACRTEAEPVQFGCLGRPGEDGRGALAQFNQPYDHDLQFHPEVCVS